MEILIIILLNSFSLDLKQVIFSYFEEKWNKVKNLVNLKKCS